MDAETVKAVVIIGRLLLGGIFVFGGIRHYFLVAPLSELIAQRGIPFPRVVLLTGTTFELLAGALLMSGHYVLPAALGLIVFTLTASWLLLPFWRQPPGPERDGAMNACLTNIGIVGGLLLAGVAGQ